MSVHIQGAPRERRSRKRRKRTPGAIRQKALSLKTLEATVDSSSARSRGPPICDDGAARLAKASEHADAIVTHRSLPTGHGLSQAHVTLACLARRVDGRDEASLGISLSS